MTAITTAEMTTGSVISKDGTRIGFLRVGQGPAVVLLHGSNESARSHIHLALALADAFTLYLPDRRGRGLSGPHRPDHGIRTEVEDLRAVLTGSGAEKVFGVSIGGAELLVAPRIVLGKACPVSEKMADSDRPAVARRQFHLSELWNPFVYRVFERQLAFVAKFQDRECGEAFRHRCNAKHRARSDRRA